MDKLIFTFFLFNILFIQSLTAQDEKIIGSTVWVYQAPGVLIGGPVLDDESIYFGDDQGYLFSVDMKNVAKNWEKHLTGGIRSKISFDKKHVYCQTDSGFVYSIFKENGKIDWKRKVGDEKQKDLWDYYLSQPVLFDEYIILGLGDGKVYALDKSNGREIWHFETNGPVHASPVVSDELVYIGSFDGFLYCLNAKNGELKWKFDTYGEPPYFKDGAIQRAVTIVDDVIFFGSRDYNLYALNKKEGNVKWFYHEPAGWIIAPPLVTDNEIFVGTSDAHKFYCFDRNSGKIKWQTNIGMRAYGKAALYKNYVITGTHGGMLYVLDQKSGKKVDHFQTEASKIHYSKLFDEDGNIVEGKQLYGPELRENELLIRKMGSIMHQPIINEGFVVFGTTTGKLYCIELLK